MFLFFSCLLLLRRCCSAVLSLFASGYSNLWSGGNGLKAIQAHCGKSLLDDEKCSRELFPDSVGASQFT